MKLSLITINYNNKIGFKQTVESVIGQTWKEFEYIIIDGGSTDGSVDVIKEYENQINFWVSEPDKGIYNAMNKGLQVAKGEYVMFLNSGDYLYNVTTLNLFSEYLSGTDIVYGDVMKIFSDDRKEIQRYENPISMSAFLERSQHLCHQAVLMSRIAINKAGGFDENYRIVSDWKLFAIAMFKNGATVKYVGVIISGFDMQGVSQSPQSKLMIDEEHRQVLKTEFPFFYADFIAYSKIGCSYYEVMNSKLIRNFMKLRLTFIQLLKK
jgi:glycosyltransferase involved in cell wall biosynthesis